MKTSLLRTKTFWGGLAAIVAGVGLVVVGDIPEGANAIVTGFIAVFLRDGLCKLAEKE